MSRRTPPPRERRAAPPRVQRATSRSGGRSSARSGSRAGAARPTGRGSASGSRDLRARRAITHREPPPPPDRAHRRASRSAPKRRKVASRHVPRRTHRFAVGRPRVRLIALLIVLVTVLTAILVKVGQLQTAGGEPLRAAASEQWTRTTTLVADRGTIFDRNGEELAVSIPTYSISVNPKLVTDPVATAQTLQAIMGLDDGEARELYDTLVAKETGFAYVRRQVPLAVGDQIASLRMPGVNVDPEDKRVVPGGSTGLSVIGRTDIDGNGIAGLELQYDALLTGTPGERTKQVAPKGRSIPGTEEVTLAPVPGDDLVLTLDRSIQFSAEQALLDRVIELGAKSGTAIVMDTATGEIYAMASVDRADDGETHVTSGNFAAVNAYEPGSVAKVITIAAALNERVVTPDSTFFVPWRKQYADDLLRDAEQHPDEWMTVHDILVRSSNIGTIETQIAMGRGDWDTARELHWNYMTAFGLGERTALDFPGESAGILKHWTDLWGSERVTVSYGQGVASTSIQLVSAVNAIANDGVYVAPSLVLATVDAEGEVSPVEPAPTREVIRPEVAATMQSLMRDVVCAGTGSRAQFGIDNFTVAGKTGTGLKPWPDGRYENDQGERIYYASFVGFFPAEDPQVTVLISIDEPPGGDINHFGGTAAAPVFARLAPTIMHELGMQPTVPTSACPPE